MAVASQNTTVSSHSRSTTNCESRRIREVFGFSVNGGEQKAKGMNENGGKAPFISEEGKRLAPKGTTIGS